MPVNIFLRDVVAVVVVVARVANGDGVGRANPCPVGARRRSTAAVFNVMMATRDGDDVMMLSIDFVAGSATNLEK